MEKIKLKSSVERPTNRIGLTLEAVPCVNWMLGVAFPSLKASSFSGSAGICHLFYFCFSGENLEKLK